MKSHHTLRVPKKKLDELNRLCHEPDASVGRGEVIFDEEVRFGTYRVAIQVVSSGEPDKEPCWTQGVLFDQEGNELAFTEVGEDLTGEFLLVDPITGDAFEVWVLPPDPIAGMEEE